MYTLKRLSKLNKTKVLEHFLRLDQNTRHSRFCCTMSYENLYNYVEKINFSKSGIFGIFNEKLDIIGVGECIVFDNDKTYGAEVAFSVESQYQGNGLGNKLMKRVVQFANINHLKELTIYFLRNNSATYHLAKKYNFKAEYSTSEVYGKVKIHDIPPVIDTINELNDEILAHIDITQKWQNKLFENNFNDINQHINKLFKFY